MSEPNQLAVVTTQPAPVARPAPSVAEMLQAAVQGGVTGENVEVLGKLVDLHERVEARNAEREYTIALARLQSECQNVIATSEVSSDRCSFRFASFLSIWNQVKPAVERNGFTLQWSQEHGGDKITAILFLRHTSGHSERFTWTMRLGTAAPGTPAGAQMMVLDSITESRAKRRLLMDALNIVVDAVTPAEDVGDGTLASAEETDALFQRLVALGGDQASQNRFLALAGVQAWNQIPKAVLPILQRLMAEKERAAARKGAQ